MYKSLAPQAIGVSGRQSELIEMALTYGFKGMNVDMREFARKVANRGMDAAARYMHSAQVRLGFHVSGFELPVRWADDEAAYKQDMEKLPKTAEVAKSLGAQGCYAYVLPASDGLPYHECFAFHQQRLGPVANELARHDIQLGLGFYSTPARRKDKKYEFIYEVEPFLKLIETLGVANVGVVVDLWHWHFGGGTLDQIKQLKADQVVNVRLADVAEDVDPAKQTDEQRLLPGKTGVIDSAGVLRILGEMEYAGPVTPYANVRLSSTGLTRDRIVRLAGEAVDAVWQEAGLNRHGRLAPDEDEDLVGAAVGAEEEEEFTPPIEEGEEGE
ncbi:MAG: sugar phosphate isomerase/epimerase [Planctomycetes bacterium]|nr:sugar phosphate isomerase/epimerase [Planctomycetota bacterium]